MAKKPKITDRLDALEAQQDATDAAISTLIMRVDTAKEYNRRLVAFIARWEHPIPVDIQILLEEM